MNDITKQSELVSYIEGLKHVRLVNQSEEAAKTLGNVNKLVSYVSIAIIALLLIISIFLISNTVSVGIAVRKEEIGIMKYIGATDAFVRSSIPSGRHCAGSYRCCYTVGRTLFLL